MASNHRASLLAGLRTGGVRSSLPQTAAPNGAFNDYLEFQPRTVPMTAAVDGPAHRFAGQQAFNPAQMQMQMLQLEMMRIQALQNQQYQLAQAQMQQQMQQLQLQQAHTLERRVSANPPATAGPAATSFDPYSSNYALARADPASKKTPLGVRSTPIDNGPMTAALGGRFGGRTASLGVATADEFEGPATSTTTTVISGGTSLGAASPGLHTVPSKSDAASSWRRGAAPRVVSSPSVKVTPPCDEHSPTAGPKFRPQPLRFSSAVSQPLPTVTVDTTDEDTDGEHSSGSSGDAASNSSPTTPRSSSSHETPLSPREEASKRLFEGLGIIRPLSATPPQSDQAAKPQPPIVSVPVVHRMASQPTRHPRGPPSGSDELGPKNFATRIRRKAIGGLGVLMGARERREIVQAY